MYRITIDRIEIDAPTQDPATVRQITTPVYSQSFDELNVAEMITRLNHVPVRRPRKAKEKAK